MTENEINEQVAKLCGWSNWSVSKRGNATEMKKTRPNFTESLDECARFERLVFLKPQLKQAYCAELVEASRGRIFTVADTLRMGDVYGVVSATALQKCSALIHACRLYAVDHL